MKIAVLSGKGGTGKTLVSVNLAATAKHAAYIDCDVEEPNGHLFFRPEQIQEKSVTVKIPVVDDDLCNGCRKCIDFCKFNALAYTRNSLMVFADICHSCGGCALVCPKEAISEVDKPIGRIQKGSSEGIHILTGFLNIGETSGVPIINKLLDCNKDSQGPVFIDCPPGSACVVMESIKDADYCILVAESTLFGVHNLEMVWELVKLFQKPFGVVLNKVMPGVNPAETFCLERNLKVLARIPFSHGLGLISSQGRIAVREDEKYEALFFKLLNKVVKEVHCETIAHS